MNTLFTELAETAKREGRTYLLEHESKKLLESEGITTTKVTVAKTSDEAVEASRNIGFPVAMKVLSPEVIHKSDRGGVRLNIKDAEQAEKAFQEIHNTFAGEKMIGVAVQKMADPGLELIIGINRDPTFGPVLMFGLGGIFVEVLQDVSFRVLPVSRREIEKMTGEIRGAKLLRGYRGKGVNLEALYNLLEKVSALVLKYPQISELDLNPAFLYPKGYIAVDARIMLSKEDKPEISPGAGKEPADLKKLFYPESIAVIGASDKEGKLGWNVFHNLLSNGFTGKLYPVNVSSPMIQGVKAYRNVRDIKDPVDLAIIIVPAALTLQAFKDCCESGIKMIVIESAGFAETGDTGGNIEKEMIRLAGEHDCRFVGPNCSGVINTHYNMVQSIGLVNNLNRGSIGLVAQAGVYAAGILRYMSRTTDFALVATIGNKTDVNETDLLDYMACDDHVKVICMYLEDIKNGPGFLAAAGRISPKKPIIILKSGRSDEGKKAAASHTASLAGNDLIFEAAFKQAGIIRAKDNDHLFDVARGLAKQPLPPGNRVLVLTYSGSLGVAAADALSANGMKLADLDSSTREQLSSILPDYVNPGNPADYTFDMNAQQVRRSIELASRSKNIDAVIAILQAENLDRYAEEFLSLSSEISMPTLCSVPCREFVMESVISLEKAGFPVYSTPERAAEVLARMYQYSQWRKQTVEEKP